MSRLPRACPSRAVHLLTLLAAASTALLGILLGAANAEAAPSSTAPPSAVAPSTGSSLGPTATPSGDASPTDASSYTGTPVAVCGSGVALTGVGTATLVVTAPTVAPSATGSETVVVCSAAGGGNRGESGGELASTGFPTGEVVAGGLVLLAAGVGLSMFAARRRPQRGLR